MSSVKKSANQFDFIVFETFVTSLLSEFSLEYT